MHKGSMLWIVNMDLKPNNILLDYNMNPRIADFGSARALSSDVAEEHTNMVVGTWYELKQFVTDSTIAVLISFVCTFQWLQSSGVCISRSLLNEDRCVQLWCLGSGDY